MVKSLTFNINIIIAQYIIEPIKTLKKWVKPYSKIGFLSEKKCPNYHKYISDRKLYKSKRSYLLVNKSKGAYDFMLKSNKINWYHVSANPKSWVRELLTNKPNKINWIGLSKNPSKWAYELLKKHPDNIAWSYLTQNESKWAYKLLKSNSDKIDWHWISANTGKWANQLLKNKPDNINWNYLQNNTSKWAYKLLKNNPTNINWAFYIPINIYKFVKMNKYNKLFDKKIDKNIC